MEGETTRANGDITRDAAALKHSRNGSETGSDISETGPGISETRRPAGKKRKKGAFRALKHRNFRLFWSAQLISLIGTWMQNLAQGWLIVLLVDPIGRAMLRHGGNAVGAAPAHHSPAVEAAANIYSGWVNFAGGLPILLFTLLAGVVADRVDKRRLLILTQACLVFTSICLGLLCVTGRVEIWHVMVFTALAGAAAAFDMPARQAFVVEMVGREDLPSAVALNSSVFNAARALGPAVAGLILAAHISIGVAFIGNGVLTLAPIAVLLMIHVSRRNAAVTPDPAGVSEAPGLTAAEVEAETGPATLAVDTPEGCVEALEAAEASEDPTERRRQSVLKRLWCNMREGFQYVRGNATVGNLVLLVGSFGTFAFSFNILVPVFVRYVLLPHAGDAAQVKAFGFMETVRGVGALAAAISVAILGNARRQRNMLIAGALLSTLALIVFARAHTLEVAYIAMAVASYGFVLCFATSNTLVQLTVPDHLRGRVMSIYTLVFIGTTPVGSLFVGWVATIAGTANTMLLCAVISLLTALLLVFRPGGLLTIGVPGGAKAA